MPSGTDCPQSRGGPTDQNWPLLNYISPKSWMTNSPDQFSKCIDFPLPHSYTYLPDKALVLIWKSDQFLISIGCLAFDWPSAFNYEWPWKSQCIAAFDMFEETTSRGLRWSESSIQWQYRNHWYVFPCFQLQSIKNRLWIVFVIITWKVPIHFYSNRLPIMSLSYSKPTHS